MKTIHHVLDIDTDPARVWAALTDADGLAGWWSTKLDTGPAAVGARIRFTFAGDFNPVMEIISIDTGHGARVALHRRSRELGRQHLPIRARGAPRRAHPPALHPELRDRAQRRRLRRLQLQLGLLPRKPPAPLHHRNWKAVPAARRVNPVIFAVAPDAALRAALEDVLRRRYGGDFEVVVANTPEHGVERLTESRPRIGTHRRRDGADAHGRSRRSRFLDTARRLHPTARRIVIIDVGDVGSAGELQSGTHAQQGRHVLRPAVGEPRGRAPPRRGRGAAGVGPRAPTPLREGDHRRRARRGARAATCARGSSGTLSRPRCTPPRATPGRELLERHGLDPGRLPVIELYDGRVLVDPADDELAEALGASTHPEARRVRRRDRRRRSRGPRGRGVCRFRRAEHRIDRAGGVGRPSGHQLEDPQLPRVPVGRGRRRAGRAREPSGRGTRHGVHRRPVGHRVARRRRRPRADTFERRDGHRARP